jgi:hypothetical protein
MTDSPYHEPSHDGLARRTADAAKRRVEALFGRHGPAFRQLAVGWSSHVAGDTLVAIGLAGTLFFSVPSGEARGNVALYLALTLAPFAVIAPVLGGIFTRFPGVYRAAMVLAALFRAVIAVAMAFTLESTFILYPLAFGMLVFSRLYGIGKASMLPVALPAPVALVGANALLARIGIYAGALVAPLGALAARVDPAVSLLLSAGFFAFCAFASLGLPDPRGGDPSPEDGLRPIELPDAAAFRGRSLRLSRLATAGVRLLNGFLLFMLAFEFRDANAGAFDFGALIAAGGAGYGIASLVSPWLERHLREEPMVVGALAVEAAAAFVAGQFFGLPAAAALSASAGLAWGTAKFAFDGLLQSRVDPAKRGTAFTRSETLFQLAWVIGAIIPVTIDMPAEVGLAVAGVAALAAQTLFVAGLLVERDVKDL